MLHLSKNKIRTVQSLDRLPKLRYADFSGNYIKELGVRRHRKVASLETLHVGTNFIRWLDLTASALYESSISTETSCPDIVNPQPKVNQQPWTENALFNFWLYQYEDQHQHPLDLPNNRMLEIDFSASNLVSLKKLDVSNNRLDSVKDFDRLPSLQNADMSKVESKY